MRFIKKSSIYINTIQLLSLYIYLGYNFTPRNVETLDEEIITTHRVIEAMKWSFAKPSILTDPDYLEITSNHSNSTGKLNKSSRRQKSLEVRLS